MKIGIGYPANIPGVQGQRLLEWAKKADAGPFTSLSLIDRLVYDNYDPLVALAAAAGATQRIHLMTTVLLAPLHSAPSSPSKPPAWTPFREAALRSAWVSARVKTTIKQRQYHSTGGAKSSTNNLQPCSASGLASA